MKINKPRIIQYSFAPQHYMSERLPKKQIFIHHTAGGSNAFRVFDGWASNVERIATCVVIGGDGNIVQGFPSECWAYHLGLKEKTFEKYNIPYQSLDKISIGIEICNWGQLTLKDGKYFNYLNKEVEDEEVCVLDTPFKGNKYFHNYTNAQIDSVKNLLLFWGEKYNIPLKYNENIWDISEDALKGMPGVYTHNSVRVDKVDIYPHPKMIEMLKAL